MFGTNHLPSNFKRHFSTFNLKRSERCEVGSSSTDFDPQSELTMHFSTFSLLLHLVLILSIWGFQERRESNINPRKVRFCTISMSVLSSFNWGV